MRAMAKKVQVRTKYLRDYLAARKTMPLPGVVESLSEDDAATREAKLLYVAITRAKSDLAITYSGDKSALPPRESGLFTEVAP